LLLGDPGDQHGQAQHLQQQHFLTGRIDERLNRPPEAQRSATKRTTATVTAAMARAADPPSSPVPASTADSTVLDGDGDVGGTLDRHRALRPVGLGVRPDGQDPNRWSGWL